MLPCTNSPTVAHVTFSGLFFSQLSPPPNSQLHVYMGRVLLPPQDVKRLPKCTVVLTVLWIGAWFVQILLKERITNKVGLLYKFSGCPHFLTMPHKTLKATGHKKTEPFLDFQSGYASDGAWISFWHFSQLPLGKTVLGCLSALNQSLSSWQSVRHNHYTYSACRYDCLSDHWHLFLHTGRTLLTFKKCCIWNILFIAAPLCCTQQSQPTPVLWSRAGLFQTRDDITPPTGSLHFLKQSSVQTQACNYRPNLCAARGRIKLWFRLSPASQNMCSGFGPQTWS